jgi:hypothetical protein
MKASFWPSAWGGLFFGVSVVWLGVGLWRHEPAVLGAIAPIGATILCFVAAFEKP